MTDKLDDEILPDEIGGVHMSDLTFQVLAEMYLALEQRLDDALGVIAMLEHHWVSPMEYYEATKALKQRAERLADQMRDIPGVDLQAKISVLRLWAEPEMERRKALAEDDLDKLTTQQKPTEEAMVEA